MISGAGSEAAWDSGNNHTPTNISTRATARLNHQQPFLHNNHTNRTNHNTQTKATPTATDTAAGAGKQPSFLFFV